METQMAKGRIFISRVPALIGFSTHQEARLTAFANLPGPSRTFQGAPSPGYEETAFQRGIRSLAVVDNFRKAGQSARVEKAGAELSLI